MLFFSITQVYNEIKERSFPKKENSGGIAMEDIRFANLSNLSAKDHLGRALPTYEEVGDVKKDKIVGLFY